MIQIEKDRLIEKFMGWELKWSNEKGSRGWSFYNTDTKEYLHKTTYSDSVIGFTTDWNRLMEALKKFDTFYDPLKLSHEEYILYSRYCDHIDRIVSLYNIDDTVNALCRAIEWYNSTLN